MFCLHPNPFYLERLSLSNEECIGVSTQTMSSPPTPNTLSKATPLCSPRPKKRDTSSIATLNLFRKKPPQHPSRVEPYEVAPGIWSTDATARVFGYFDTNKKGAESKVQSAASDIQAPSGSQKAKRKPLPIRSPLSECKQAHGVGRTEQYNIDTTKDEAEAVIRSRQERRDDPEVKRVRMRTVSRDDQLVERGANPRTGLVSPFFVSDNSEECLKGDYVAVGKVGSTGPLQRRETHSGKWKQDSLGWSLVESPLLSPIAQSMSDKTSRTIPRKQLEDRSLVEMPSVDDSDPEDMTDGQIKKYHEELTRAYRRGGGSLAMLDPDTLQSSRQWTPEGPSTPPAKLHKIQRKEVGSDVIRKSNSGNTVIINASNRASSLPTPRKDTMKRQKVRITTPSNTPKGSSFESCKDITKEMRKTDPFLGQGSRMSRMTCSSTASATQFQSYQNAGRAHQCLQKESKSSPLPTLSAAPPNSPTLSQYLSPLQFLHSNHFANLKTSSYRRPGQLFPARLRPLRQQRQAVEDVCTTTFTTTSTEGPRWEQRPKIQRQEGNSVVPRVKHLSTGYETTLDGYRQAFAPRKEQSYPSATLVDTPHTSGLLTGRSQAFGPTEKAVPARDLAGTRYQRKTPMPADCLGQPPCEDWPRNLASPTRITQGLSLGSANVVRQQTQRNQSGGGSTPTYGHPGNKSEAVPAVRLHNITEDKEQAVLSAELTAGVDSRVGLARNWDEVEKEGERADLTTVMQEEALARRRSALRKAADVTLSLNTAEGWAEPLAKLEFIQQLLNQMVCHIMRTLHHASPALTTMRTADATTGDHFRAMKDLALAAVYLLALLNLFMLLRGMLVFASKVLYWVWHPVQAILMIIGWCVVG